MRSIRKKTPTSSFYFYESEGTYKKSPARSASYQPKTKLNPLKYHSVRNDLRREIQLYGRVLPKTMDVPTLKTVSRTLSTPKWSSDSSSTASEFFFILNSKDYHA